MPERQVDEGFETYGRDLLRLEEAPDWIADVSRIGGRWRRLSLGRGRHKLIRTCRPGDFLRLFDLGTDPGELVDCSADLPEVTRALTVTSAR